MSKAALYPIWIQKDFKIFDEGKEQKIEFFTRERNQPVVVGFLLDMSNASRIHWKTYQEAAIELISTLLPNDPEVQRLFDYLQHGRRGRGQHDAGLGETDRAGPENQARRRCRAVRRHLDGVYQPQACQRRADRAAACDRCHRRRSRQREQEDDQRSPGDRAAQSGHHLRREHGGVRV